MAAIVSQIVEVCVFRLEKNRPQYLLLQRSANDDLYPNMWQIITGTIAENETMINAAVRELKEETSLSLKRFWIVPFVNSFYEPSRDFIHLAPMFAIEVDNALEPHMSSEHERYEWLPYHLARKRLVWPGQRFGLDIIHDFIIGGKEAARLVEVKHV